MARSRRSSSDSSSNDPPPPPPTLDEKIIASLLPWRIELAGGALALFSFITLLGLIGLTSSGLLNWWTRIWRELVGWGAYPLFLSLVFAGLYIASRRWPRPYQIRTPQVIGFELMLFAALPLSYQFFGGSLPAGLRGAGGYVGWALAQPLLDFLGPLLTALLYISIFLFGAALLGNLTWRDAQTGLRHVARTLNQWASTIDTTPTTPQPTLPTPLPSTPPPPEPEQPPVVIHKPKRIRKARRRKRDPRLPPLDLLAEGVTTRLTPAEIDHKKATIEQTLQDFGLAGKVTEVRQGPAITQFGVTPGYLERTGPDGEPRQQKIRVGQIAALNKDLALALAVPRLRIQAPVPGRGIVGIEVPNTETSMVTLKTILESTIFQQIRSNLSVALGQDVSGAPLATNLGKLPHLLIAGTTGSGKSVFLNSLIACLVCNNVPEQLQLILIDPKKVELIRYNGLPHLLGKVEVEHERVNGVLRWITGEMDRRYQSFAEVGARDLAVYNEKIVKYKDAGPLPHIILIIDELADLMAMYGADVERALCRLAQMARATGIHLVVATQRPSTDVITGLIKANFPARASFAVASGMDSRVILDSIGAESLLGRGDMLFLPPDASAPQRVQGCFVSDAEIEAIVHHWQKIMPDDWEPQNAPWENLIERQTFLEETDELLEEAIALAKKYDMLSTSALQRRLRVGYPRAARIMATLFEMGLVEDAKEGGRTRRSLVGPEDDDPIDEFLSEGM